MPRQLTPKGEASRRTIIQEAYRLFLEKGYYATSIRDISSSASLTIGGVYAHFANKEEIFTAVLDEYHPFRQVFDAILTAEGETVEIYAYDAAHKMVAALGTQRQALNMLFIEIVEFQGKHFADLFPEIFPRLIEMTQRMTRQKGATRPIPSPILGRSFFGMFFSYYITSIVLADQLGSNEKSLDAFVDIYLNGILA
jgi:AcrR family transcriptional regulator